MRGMREAEILDLAGIRCIVGAFESSHVCVSLNRWPRREITRHFKQEALMNFIQRMILRFLISKQIARLTA